MTTRMRPTTDAGIDLGASEEGGFGSSSIAGVATPSQFRTAGCLGLIAVALCVTGAAILEFSGADLFAAMEVGDPAERAGHLSDVAANQTNVLWGLGVWMLAFSTFAVAGTLFARLGTDRSLAAVARAGFIASLGLMVMFLTLMMSFVVGIAPAHAAGEDVHALARTIGFAASTTDWITSALVMGFAPAVAVWAGRNNWAPMWLQRFALVTVAVALVELAALAFNSRDLAMVIVPVGLAHFAAMGVAAIRFGRRVDGINPVGAVASVD